jgi:hypothetical protein
MNEKLLAICAVLFALAALPAMASASPVLTENGLAVATGKTVKAVNIGDVTFGSASERIECQSSELKGTVRTNSGKLIEGQVESSTFTGVGSESRCTTTWFGSPAFSVTSPQSMCLSSSVLGSGKLLNGTCPSSGSFTFTLHNSLLGTCRYRAVSDQVAFIYNTGSTPLHITVTNQVFNRVDNGSGGSCNGLYPASGNLNATYKVTTTDGTNLSVS